MKIKNIRDIKYSKTESTPMFVGLYLDAIYTYMNELEESLKIFDEIKDFYCLTYDDFKFDSELGWLIEKVIEQIYTSTENYYYNKSRFDSAFEQCLKINDSFEEVDSCENKYGHSIKYTNCKRSPSMCRNIDCSVFRTGYNSRRNMRVNPLDLMIVAIVMRYGEVYHMDCILDIKKMVYKSIFKDEFFYDNYY